MQREPNQSMRTMRSCSQQKGTLVACQKQPIHPLSGSLAVNFVVFIARLAQRSNNRSVIGQWAFRGHAQAEGLPKYGEDWREFRRGSPSAERGLARLWRRWWRGGKSWRGRRSVPVYCYIWTALMKSRVYISRRRIVPIPVDSGGVGTYLRARSTEPKLSPSGLAFHRGRSRARSNVCPSGSWSMRSRSKTIQH
jgi:hypothetical protein